MYLLFNSNIMHLDLKTNDRRNRRPNFVIFAVWCALIVGRWVVAVRSRKSFLVPAEFASFVFLVLFKYEECRVRPRFHLFVSDDNPLQPSVTFLYPLTTSENL